MTHDAFLQAILETPDDDAPRLVYADWLEEQGDPHGPFIRLQCQLAAMADDDPRRLLLEAEEARLEAGLREALQGHTRPPWAAKVPRIVLRDGRWRFRRGLIGWLSITANQYLGVAGALHRAAPVQHLYLRNVTRYLGDLFATEGLRNVRSLGLTGNKLSSTGMRALCESPNV